MEWCEDLEGTKAEPMPPGGCVECERIGGRWLHLRYCSSCGLTHCCDSSPNRHATAHWRETGHPVVRSKEPGETWAWCYRHEAVRDPVM